MKEVKNKPTKEEKEIAAEMQAPMASAPRTIQSEDAPVRRSNTFAQLSKVSRNARIMFGGNAQWIQPTMLFNLGYRQGDESVPFYVTRAWKYTSKQGYGERLGLEIALSNGRMYNVGLGLSEGDAKRNNLLLAFEVEDKQMPPIGPFCFRMLPLDRGNDYYDIVPYENELSDSTELVQIPFVEINDKDIPF